MKKYYLKKFIKNRIVIADILGIRQLLIPLLIWYVLQSRRHLNTFSGFGNVELILVRCIQQQYNLLYLGTYRRN
jgi:hypothetical protein